MKTNEKIALHLAPTIAIQMGDSLYSNLASGLCEFISNAYDADAEKVIIEISKDKDKELIISISDDGNGMSFDDLKNKFFDAGINRRLVEKTQKTQKKKRLVTGKKGIGKLAMLGLAKEIIVWTCKDEIENELKISLKDIKAITDSREYYPEHTIQNEQSLKKNGTRITLIGVNKNIPKDLSDQFYRRIDYLQDDFVLFLKMPNNEEKMLTRCGRKLFFEQGIFKKWNIPDDFMNTEVYKRQDKINEVKATLNYFRQNKINGFLVAKEKTIKARVNRGIALFARGKLCCESNFFKIQDANDYSYAYLYGELNVDFLDEDDEEDFISTSRKELRDTIEVEELEKHLQVLLNMYREIYTWEKKNDTKTLEYEKNRISDQDFIENKLEAVEDGNIQKSFYALYDEVKKKNSDSLTYHLKQVIKELDNARYFFKIDLPDHIIKRSNELYKDYKQCRLLLMQKSYDDAIARSYKTLNSFLEEYFPNKKEKDKEERLKEIIKRFYEKFDDRIKGNLNNFIIHLKDMRNVSEHREKRSGKEAFLGDFQSAEICINACFTFILFVHKILDLSSDRQSPDSLEEGQHSQSDEQ